MQLPPVKPTESVLKYLLVEPTEIEPAEFCNVPSNHDLPRSVINNEFLWSLEDPETTLAVARTCKRLYTEASRVYFGSNHFEFPYGSTFSTVHLIITGVLLILDSEGFPRRDWTLVHYACHSGSEWKR
jgi:hypothetical protein